MLEFKKETIPYTTYTVSETQTDYLKSHSKTDHSRQKRQQKLLRITLLQY